MLCSTLLVPTQKLMLFPEVAKVKKLNLQKLRDWTFCKKIFRSVHKMMLCTQYKDHSFSSKKCFLLVSRQKIIQKVVVSDSWKYIESIEILSQKLGDIYLIAPRKFLQNWHSDYVIVIEQRCFSEMKATSRALLGKKTTDLNFSVKCATIRAHRRILQW